MSIRYRAIVLFSILLSLILLPSTASMQEDGRDIVSDRIWLPLVAKPETDSPQVLGAQNGCTNVILNPSFDQGTLHWNWWDPGCMWVTSTNGQLNVNITKVCGNVQAYQFNIPLQPYTRYYLSFDARSNTGHDMAVALIKHGSPYTFYGLSMVPDITPAGQTFSAEFTTSGFATPVNDGRLRFIFNGYAFPGDQYWLDNVRLATCPLSPMVDAAFTGTPTTGVAPLTVQFTDQSSGGPTTWAWNFGDGGTSTMQNPSHTYTAPGVYTVSLTAANATGSDTETKSGYVRVDPSSTTQFEHRYILVQADLTQPGESQRVADLVNAADSYGYNGIVLYDWGLFTLPAQSTTFLNQLAAIRTLLDEADWDFVPWITPKVIGDVTDPATIEAFPVRDTAYIAGPVGSRLMLEHTDNLIANSGFETNLDGWYADEGVVRDPTTARTGTASVQFAATPDQARRLSLDMRTLAVEPFTAYRLTFWLKTQDISEPGAPYAYIARQYDRGGQTVGIHILHQNPIYPMSAQVLTNQDWTPYEIHFNTLDTDGAGSWLNLWLGSGATTGTMWIDDVSIVAAPLYNAVTGDAHRPIVVKQGDTVLIPYRDYRVDGDAIVNLRLPQGTPVSVDWYQAPDYPLRGLTPSVFCKPGLAAQFDDDVRTIVAKTAPDGVAIFWDELRIFNWSPECGEQTAGQLLATVTSDYQSRVHALAGDTRQYLWSDMYDPYHNGVGPFYWASNGPFTGSWNGIWGDPRTVIINWNSPFDDPNDPTHVCDAACQLQAKQDSLDHFSALGVCQMVAAYYDDPGLYQDQQWSNALTAALQDKPTLCLDGYLYATFGNANYDHLCQVAQYWSGQGRWPEPVTSCD